MRDFGAATGLVLPIEGLLMAGFTGSRGTRMAIAALENRARLRSVGLGAALRGVMIVWASPLASSSALSRRSSFPPDRSTNVRRNPCRTTRCEFRRRIAAGPNRRSLRR
jgi:uncharacterized protein YjeT (DUF2065 family)